MATRTKDITNVNQTFWSVTYCDSYGPVATGYFKSKQEAIDHASTIINRHPKGLNITKTQFVMRPKQAPYELIEMND